MILYLDTSALVKRYFQELFTAEVLTKWNEARAIASSSVAYAETMAVIYRKQREEDLGKTAVQDLVKTFQMEWQSMIRVEVCDELNPYIDTVLQHHALRGFDAVHLASALLLRSHVGDNIFFACFDHKLNQGARANGLHSF